MVSSHLIQRSIPIGACAAAILFCATPASAGKRAACTPAYAAYKDALEREKAGHLREARELLQTCMAATVCAGLVPKCTAKFNDLGSEMSSVVPVVTDDAGEPRVDIQVKVDGTLLTSRLDGKGLPVEPGVHEFTFSTDSGVFSTQKMMIVEGQRNRPISALLHSGGHKAAALASVATVAPVNDRQAPDGAPPPEKAAPERTAPDKAPPEKTASDAPAPRDTAPEAVPQERRSGGRSGFSYVLGGVGALGLGAGALLTYWGIKDNSQLGQCSPNCPQSSVDHIRTLYLASDIALGAGVVALGVGTWLFLRSGPSDEKAPSQEGYRFSVHPTPSGAFASVARTF